MEALRTIWSFALLFGLLAYAQLMGVLIFFRIERYQHFLAHVSGFLIPILLSVGFCWLILVYRYYYFHPNDHCGGQLVGALGIIAFAVVVQTILGLSAQVILHTRNQTCASK